MFLQSLMHVDCCAGDGEVLLLLLLLLLSSTGLRA
jgi:hypothetical protein